MYRRTEGALRRIEDLSPPIGIQIRRKAPARRIQVDEQDLSLSHHGFRTEEPELEGRSRGGEFAMVDGFFVDEGRSLLLYRPQPPLHFERSSPHQSSGLAVNASIGCTPGWVPALSMIVGFAVSKSAPREREMEPCFGSTLNSRSSNSIPNPGAISTPTSAKPPTKIVLLSKRTGRESRFYVVGVEPSLGPQERRASTQPTNPVRTMNASRESCMKFPHRMVPCCSIEMRT